VSDDEAAGGVHDEGVGVEVLLVGSLTVANALIGKLPRFVTFTGTAKNVKPHH
jgi:hypothetical protein